MGPETLSVCEREREEEREREKKRGRERKEKCWMQKERESG